MRGGIPTVLIGNKELPVGGREESDGTASLRVTSDNATDIESTDWQDELLSLMRRLVFGMELAFNKGNKIPDPGNKR